MSKGPVLITGVNGYIAARAAQHFLEHGYSVRGTVRRNSAGEELSQGPLKEYAAQGKFSTVEVKDITVPGAFEEAVKGVTAILHLASPVSFAFKDPEPILKAAKKGTQTILESAHAFAGPQLKAVVVMSSIAAVINATPAPYTFTEKDWNDVSEKICEEKGTETPGPTIYAASKAAAEKVFWAFRDEVKPAFGMASVNPVFVIGPPLTAPKTTAAIGETVHIIWQVFSGVADVKPMPGLSQAVDVRDVAQLLRYAVEHPDETDGERYIASGSINHPQAVADILREELKADSAALARIAQGTPGQGYTSDYQQIDPQGGISVDSSKARKLLKGGEWTSYGTSVIDTAKTFVGLL